MLIATSSGPPGTTKTITSWKPGSLRNIGTIFCSNSFVNSVDALGFNVMETMRVNMLPPVAVAMGNGTANLARLIAESTARPGKGSLSRYPGPRERRRRSHHRSVSRLVVSAQFEEQPIMHSASEDNATWGLRCFSGECVERSGGEEIGSHARPAFSDALC